MLKMKLVDLSFTSSHILLEYICASSMWHTVCWLRAQVMHCRRWPTQRVATLPCLFRCCGCCGYHAQAQPEETRAALQFILFFLMSDIILYPALSLHKVSKFSSVSQCHDSVDYGWYDVSIPTLVSN